MHHDKWHVLNVLKLTNEYILMLHIYVRHKTENKHCSRNQKQTSEVKQPQPSCASISRRPLHRSGWSPVGDRITFTSQHTAMMDGCCWYCKAHSHYSPAQRLSFSIEQGWRLRGLWEGQSSQDGPMAWLVLGVRVHEGIVGPRFNSCG